MGQYSRKRSARSGLVRPTKRARTMRTTYRRKRTFKRPARFATSRKRYTMNRMISKQVNKFIETKYNPCRQVDLQNPQPIQLGAKAYYEGYVIGNLPATWDTGLIAIDGISTKQGDAGVRERTGNYVYLKKNHFTLEIDMKPASDNLAATPLTEFRVVVCKQRRAVIPTGQAPSPQNTLFLNLDNSEFGYQTSNKNGTDLMRQPLNKRDWVIFTDKKFTLSAPPTVLAGSGLQPQTYSQKYGSHKRMMFNMPFYKKTRYAPPAGGSLFSFPTDIDFHYGVFIFARPVNKDNPANQWQTNVRAVTTYQDA